MCALEYVVFLGGCLSAAGQQQDMHMETPLSHIPGMLREGWAGAAAEEDCISTRNERRSQHKYPTFKITQHTVGTSQVERQS
jgi:hypothetical protein